MKYAPGLLVGQLSGSVGNTTASHNRNGAYLRSRVIPVNPNSSSQQAVRGLFGGFAQDWRSLTESQRAGWASLAEQVPRTDALGQSYVLTGLQLYSGVNLQRDAVGNAPIDDAPGLDSAAVITSLSLANVAGVSLSLTYTATGGLAGNDLIIRASATRSAGKTFVKRSELKQITVVAGNVASPIALIVPYEALFGANWGTQLGMEIVVEMFPVSANGLAGVGVKAVTTIA